MDILQRATGMIDKAQIRVMDATQQVARNALTVTRLRALEARQVTLRAQIEESVVELGKRTFQRWKNHGVGNDAELVSLCQTIEAHNAEYQSVLGEIADLRAAGMSSPRNQHPGALPPHQPADHGAWYTPAWGGDDVARTLAGLAHDNAPPDPRIAARQARECPECFTLVPGSSHYCPSCGMRA